MLPSRGLRWSSQSLGIGRRRIEHISTRSFSYSSAQRSSLRASPLLSNNGALISKLSQRPQVLRSSLLSPFAVGLRYQSTTPTPATEVAAASSTSAPVPTESLDNAFDFAQTSLLDVPETIGYLHSLGLDYGWGPTSAVEWLLEHVHVLAGTPWWASIAITAFLFRAALFKPYMDAADNAAKLATVQPITKPLMAKQLEFSRMGDTAAAMAIRRDMQMIHRRAGIKLWKTFVPMIQVFFGYGTFILLRGMSQIPVPGLETGGMLWFPNLAIPDPYMGLPIITAGIMHFVLRKGGETGVNTLSPGVLKAMSYGLPALTLVFTWWLPAGLQLSFLVSGALSSLQALLFRTPGFRAFAGMTPMPQKTTNPFDKKPEEAPSPFQPRVVVAQKGSYRPTYEAPTRGSSTSKRNIYGTAFDEPEKAKGIFGGLKQTVGSKVEEVRKGLQDNLKSARDKVNGTTKDGSRSKAELKEAQAYEKKRREEQRRAMEEMDERRKLERMERRRRGGD